MTIMAVALAVAGCSRAAEIKPTALHTNHVSPPPVAVPRLPPGSFDQAKAEGERTAAAAARQAGDPARARAQAEASVSHWPADLAAWDELAADCQALKDDPCWHYAVFFHGKVEFVAKLPPRAAVLGFASLASNTVGTHSGDYVYDRRTLDTALHLASFYDEQDEIRALRLPERPVQMAPKKKQPAANPASAPGAASAPPAAPTSP